MNQALAPSQRFTVHLLLSLGAFIMVIPFLWMVLTSFKTISEATMMPPVIIPESFNWSNYTRLFELFHFMDLYFNTIVSTVIRVSSQLILCSLAAYAFARIQFPGKAIFFGIILSVMMIPQMLYLIPKFLMMSSFGWVNTMQGLVAPGMFSAFGTFLMRQFFLTLPGDLADSAKIDGCNHFRTFILIMLPLAKPGMIALGIFVTLWSWNDLLWPLIILNSPTKLTLAVGLAAMQGEYTTNYPAMMAGALMGIMPMLILFFLLQKHFIEGIALTGTKG
jgi:multiple sugar transport system permease protein